MRVRCSLLEKARPETQTGDRAFFSRIVTRVGVAVAIAPVPVELNRRICVRLQTQILLGSLGNFRRDSRRTERMKWRDRLAF